jgi:hypothetical protein
MKKDVERYEGEALVEGTAELKALEGTCFRLDPGWEDTFVAGKFGNIGREIFF